MKEEPCNDKIVVLGEDLTNNRLNDFSCHSFFLSCSLLQAEGLIMNRCDSLSIDLSHAV